MAAVRWRDSGRPIPDGGGPVPTAAQLDEEIDIHEDAREKGVWEETIRRAVRDGRIPDRRANPKGRHRVRRGDTEGRRHAPLPTA